MIRAFVDFALRARLLMLAIAIMLLVWGAIAFHNLPIEAYPDVANTTFRSLLNGLDGRLKRSNNK
jgi:Cu/Ag efflux pump CusA